jgi:adenylate cyclase
MPGTRQLATIMFTDIAGYTALVHDDETHARLLRDRHRDVLKSQHGEFNGKIIQYYGDGSLSIFHSAIEAVRCAIEIQKLFISTPRVPVRVGLHLGDIILDEEGAFGDGVNLAARIESLSVPGAVLISDRINDEIGNQRDLTTQPMGVFAFKNVKREVGVFAVDHRSVKMPDKKELSGKTRERLRSIAVLPFVNMSADKENEYFSDGISEEILNVLTKVSGLQVTARTSSFAFKGENKPIQEIGRILGARYILEGSVRKAGNRVRITAQLIKAVDGYHMFSETYDRTLDDIFELQDEIAQKIANRLRKNLDIEAHNAPLVQQKERNLEAYDNYLKGLHHFGIWEAENAKRAIPYFEKAIAMQADFAEPYAQLASCHIILFFAKMKAPEQAYADAKYFADKAVLLDPDLVEGLSAVASYKAAFEWDWQGIEKIVDKMLKINSGKAVAYFPKTLVSQVHGRLDEAEEAYMKAISLDPLSFTMNLYYGWLLAWRGKFDKAHEILLRLSDFHPHNRTVREAMGWLCLLEGDHDKAIEILTHLEPELGYVYSRPLSLGCAYARAGNRDKANECLTRLEELEAEHAPMSFALDKAILYAATGERDKAFVLLEGMIDHHHGMIIFIKMDVVWESLRSDPRFELLVKRVTG